MGRTAVMAAWNSMSMTIEKIRAIMKIPKEQMAALLREIDVPYSPERVLSDEEIQRLRAVMLRKHQLMQPQQTGQESISTEPAGKGQNPAESAECDVPVDSQMEQLVLEKKIMIDTCSLMHDKCEVLIDKLLPALQKHRKKVVIPARVIDELKKHQRDHRDPFRAVSANQGLLLCSRLQKAGCLSIRGAERDNFADNTFFVAISRYRYEYNILLITQDRKLSQDILRLNEMQVLRGYPVEVRYLNNYGQLNPSMPFTSIG